ncbi:hypothetical protein AR1Y2_0691 [Anaerostipes rhamnosivorans]|uniref:Uncharacterized protein n=1 Tax=Anaerostipes rhamnosivorans TaxID=1229621 RepID=A0A4P8IBX1_9FIRM|nr:hypothetical protein AR1Y2_0691 [Anaerostipes rhamnosivorans]
MAVPASDCLTCPPLSKTGNSGRRLPEEVSESTLYWAQEAIWLPVDWLETEKWFKTSHPEFVFLLCYVPVANV